MPRFADLPLSNSRSFLPARLSLQRSCFFDPLPQPPLYNLSASIRFGTGGCYCAPNVRPTNSVQKAHPEVILTGVDWIRVAKGNESASILRTRSEFRRARPSEV